MIYNRYSGYSISIYPNINMYYSPNIPHADAHIIISNNHWHQFNKMSVNVLLLLYYRNLLARVLVDLSLLALHF